VVVPLIDAPSALNVAAPPIPRRITATSTSIMVMPLSHLAGIVDPVLLGSLARSAKNVTYVHRHLRSPS
jgi:hypothetical protein